MNTAIILLDIEGTVAPISFVKDVLFPYSLQRMDGYLARNSDKEAIGSVLLETREIVLAETGFLIDMYEAAETLRRWVNEDRKAAPLKRLQGFIWAEGYAKGELHTPLYSDVTPMLKQWASQGLKLAIYSSGSVQAQQVFFANTDQGDLTPQFSAWFDTENAGPKREARSYSRIAEALGVVPGAIHFLSDIPEEIMAAQQAGLKATQIVRPGTDAAESLPTAATLSEVTP